MDGRGRATDNVFIERLWRTVKCEEVYLKEYASGVETYSSIKGFFDYYD
jgi:putative transposase